MGSSDEISKYIGECRDMGIAVLPPDINESNWAFTVVGDRIRFGLGAVKGVGEGAVEAILAARRRVGRFDGIAHVAVELDTKQLNQKVFDCLVKAGSFDSLGVPRASLCASIEKIVEHAQQRRKEREAGQGALFAPAATSGPSIDSRVREWPEVVAAFVVTGESHYLLRVLAHSLKHYSDFVLSKRSPAEKIGPGATEMSRSSARR